MGGRFAALQTLAVVACIAVALAAPARIRTRFTPAQNVILNAWFDRDDYRCGKLLRIVEPFAASCTLAEPRGDAPLVLLVGDSHADALKSVLRDTAYRRGAGLRLMKANCTLGKTPCSLDAVLTEIAANQIDAIVVHDSPGSISIEVLKQLVAAGLERGFSVVAIDPVPVWPAHVPAALFMASITGQHHGLPAQDIDQYRNSNRHFSAQIASIDAPNFYRQPVESALCSPSCQIVESASGAPLYFDAGHLTLTGAFRIHNEAGAVFDFIARHRSLMRARQSRKME